MLDKHPELEDKDLPYFQTLHSFAFNLLGMKKSNVMQNEDYLLLVEKLVSKYLYSQTVKTAQVLLTQIVNTLNLISAAKIRNISIEEEFNSNMYSEDLDFEIVKILKLELDNRKEAFKLVDFNDMIQKFIDRANDLCPTFDVVFIDEAQDLSPIQWKMYDELKKEIKAYYFSW